MDYHYREKRNLLMSFLRHNGFRKYKRSPDFRTPFTIIFVSHQVYPWQVALQQSLLLFNLTKQKYHDMFDYKKTAKKKCNHFVHLRTTTQKKQPFCLLYLNKYYNVERENGIY